MLAGGTPAVHTQGMDATKITIDVSGETTSGLWLAPPEPRACLVLAHGAGAGMAHKAMGATANGLAERGVATLRYNFLYMEQGGKRPDAPARREVPAPGMVRVRAGPRCRLPVRLQAGEVP